MFQINMDGSDQEDFVDLCSKQLKRVRKKPPDPGEPRSADPQPVKTQPRAPDFPKRRRRKNDVRTASAGKATPQTDRPTPASDPIQLKHPLKHDGAELEAGVSGSSVSGADDQAVEADDQAVEAGLGAAQKVVRSMQQFKRCSPQKLSHGDRIQCSEIRQDHHDGPPVLPCQDLQDIDQALAVRLQEEMDREARGPSRGGLEERGLFFCQLCHRDLSHMSPTGRTQHTNRCLDESEDSAPCAPAPAPPPAIPECPICGKLFKTLKSRSAHLKRCSSHMGVAPAVLLQALQKQAAEALSDGSASQSVQTGGSKRKGPKSDPSLPVKKKPRKRAPNLDEDTMVALALSSSLLEQERKREVEREAMAAAVPPGSVAALLRWQAHEAGRRGKKKRKKGSAPRPPPLLLVQDPDAALRRLQDRVAALLLRTRAPSPPTPTLRPSSLPAWCSAGGGGDEGGAPLWRKSALRDGGPRSAAEFYTAELREFISPPEETQTAPSPPPSSPGSSTQAGARPAPGGGSLPVGSQALADLLDLAEEGMTLTQWGYSSSGKGKDSGVAPEGDLCLSGFILDDTRTRSQRDDTHTHTQRSDTHTRSPDVQTGQSLVAPLSRLTSDLSSMVNNPQLSDIQLQVDDGEVYFAHSFMLYARCPLLAHTVHDSGFGVKEDGSPAAQRLLLSEVPGPAVSALLLYLYTARCSPTPSLLPHLQQLACRFDLPELQELCRDPPGHTELQEESGGEGQACQDNPDRELPSGEEKSGDQAFMELLRSMWNEEEEEEEDGGEGVGGGEGVEGEMGVEEEEGGEEGVALEDEERVNEEELEEIYEFAATQRKREEGKEHTEEEGEAVEEEEEAGSNAGAMEQENISPDLDRSYNCLFSDSWGDYEDRDPPSQPPRSQPPPSVSQPLRPRDGRRATEETPCLHSTVSEVIDLSISPPASRPSVPDLSPGEVSPAGARRDPSEGVGAGEDRGEDRDHVSAYGGASQKKVGSDEEKPSPKRTAQGARSASLPRSPPRARKEPELIVLSDSSEEMEVDPPPGGISPSPPPPPPTQNQQDFTQIRPRTEPHPEPGSPHLEGEEKSLSPPEGHLTEPGPDPEAHSPLMDFSPEVSWLIPATPLQARTSSSSTQTQSSMRRMQLFPKTSSSSSARSSSLQTSSDPPPASTHPAQKERPISRVKSWESASQGSSLDGDLSPKRRSRTAIDKDAEGDSDSSQVFTIPSSRPRWLSYPSLPPSLPLIPPSDPSAKGTPVHCLPQPHSSTPLHPDLPEPPALPSASPLLRGSSTRHGWPRGRADTQSPGRTGLGTLRLSLSNSPCMGSPSRGPDPCRPLVESGDASSSGSRKLTMEGEEEMRVEERRTSHGGEEKEGMEAEEEKEEGSGGRSFLVMDEPPMAFDDSWGLNAGDGPSEQEVCFSLRMDSTGAQSSLSPPPPPSPRTIPPSPSPPPIAHLHPATPSSTCSPPASALLGSKLWSDWEEEEAEVGPLSQRVNTVAPAQRVDQLRTPVASRRREQLPLVAITPLPCYSDMDTPDLKNKLNRFGVRPLPKRQMILKLKEIHHYTHQLVSSESDDEAPSLGRAAQARPLPSSTASSRPAPCASGGFKQPGAPPAASPVKRGREEEQEPLSASQGSSTSSTAASDDSERSNPELCPLSDEDDGSDGDLTSSQASSRLQDRLQAARRFILSDPELYGRVLQYQPLGLALLQAQLKQAGITLGTAKLMDFLDANCITFTTAKPGQGRKQRRGGGGRGGGGRGRGGRRKKVVAPTVTN